MILKNIKTTYNFFLLSIIILCFPQPRTVLASTEPIINVLILKDKQIRIRADRSIPLTIKGQRFSNKKIKGLTLKKQNNGTTLNFDKNYEKSIFFTKSGLKTSLGTILGRSRGGLGSLGGPECENIDFSLVFKRFGGRPRQDGTTANN